ncbi:hypothetical protein BHE74_00006933 [Ensete ventricosum]|nr:hypothetical protein BHE74_00006933 [Ensete ventricosum]
MLPSKVLIDRTAKTMGLVCFALSPLCFFTLVQVLTRFLAFAELTLLQGSALIDRVHDTGQVISAMDNKADGLHKEIQELKGGSGFDAIATTDQRAFEAQSFKLDEVSHHTQVNKEALPTSHVGGPQTLLHASHPPARSIDSSTKKQLLRHGILSSAVDQLEQAAIFAVLSLAASAKYVSRRSVYKKPYHSFDVAVPESTVSGRKRRMRKVIAGFLLVLAVAHLVAEPAGAITCQDVSNTIGSCVAYVTGKQPRPTAACCAGVRRLNSLASNTAARRTACNCLKSRAGQVKNIRDQNVSALPGLCSVSLRFRLSTSTDCNS